MDSMSLDEYIAMIRKPKSKYRNRPQRVDDLYFPSQKEADRYAQLKLLHRAQEILGFGRQIRFTLASGLEYVADFVVWHKDGRVVVEDTKGMRTKEYIAKIKVFRELYPDLDFVEL